MDFQLRLIGRAVEITLWSREKQELHNFTRTKDHIVEKALRTACKEFKTQPNEERFNELLVSVNREFDELMSQPRFEVFHQTYSFEEFLTDYWKLNRGIVLRNEFGKYAVVKGWKRDIGSREERFEKYLRASETRASLYTAMPTRETFRDIFEGIATMEEVAEMLGWSLEETQRAYFQWSSNSN
jgi:hypothetical protein